MHADDAALCKEQLLCHLGALLGIAVSSCAHAPCLQANVDRRGAVPQRVSSCHEVSCWVPYGHASQLSNVPLGSAQVMLGRVCQGACRKAACRSSPDV